MLLSSVLSRISSARLPLGHPVVDDSELLLRCAVFSRCRPTALRAMRRSGRPVCFEMKPKSSFTQAPCSNDCSTPTTRRTFPARVRSICWCNRLCCSRPNAFRTGMAKDSATSRPKCANRLPCTESLMSSAIELLLRSAATAPSMKAVSRARGTRRCCAKTSLRYGRCSQALSAWRATRRSKKLSPSASAAAHRNIEGSSREKQGSETMTYGPCSTCFRIACEMPTKGIGLSNSTSSVDSSSSDLQIRCARLTGASPFTKYFRSPRDSQSIGAIASSRGNAPEVHCGTRA